MRVTIVIPTYNERENLRPLVKRIAATTALPLKLPLPAGGGETLEWGVLVVDDNSPDGTGALAEELAREHPFVRVLHRQRKEGLGAALLAGFRSAFDVSARAAPEPTPPGGSYSLSGRIKNMTESRVTYSTRGRVSNMSRAEKWQSESGTGTAMPDVIIQMDADGSHEPEEIPGMIARIRDGADVVVGSRCVSGGRIIGWGLHRRAMSASAQWFARRALGFHTRDVTSGFRAWRTDALARALAATPMYGS